MKGYTTLLLGTLIAALTSSAEARSTSGGPQPAPETRSILTLDASCYQIRCEAFAYGGSGEYQITWPPEVFIVLEDYGDYSAGRITCSVYKGWIYLTVHVTDSTGATAHDTVSWYCR